MACGKNKIVEAELREQMMKLEKDINESKILIREAKFSTEKLQSKLDRTEEKIAEKNNINDQIIAYNEKIQNKGKKIKMKKKPKVEKPPKAPKPEKEPVIDTESSSIPMPEKAPKAPKAPKPKKPNPKNVAKLNAPKVIKAPTKTTPPRPESSWVKQNSKGGWIKKNSSQQHSQVNYLMATVDYSELLAKCIQLHEDKFAVPFTIEDLKALARHESLQHHSDISTFANENTQKFIKKNLKLSEMLHKLNLTNIFFENISEMTEKNLRQAYIIAQIECLEKAVKHNDKTARKREQMEEKLISAF